MLLLGLMKNLEAFGNALEDVQVYVQVILFASMILDKLGKIAH
jgi:hypothetical protein